MNFLGNGHLGGFLCFPIKNNAVIFIHVHGSLCAHGRIEVLGWNRTQGCLMPKHCVMLPSLTESYVETNIINSENGDDPWLMEKFPRDEHCLWEAAVIQGACPGRH